MAALGEGDIEGVLAACGENLEAIGQSLNQCFDSSHRVGTGDSLPWSADEIPPIFDGPGLAVVFAVGGQSVVCLIPDSLLPDWHLRPNDSQQSRLQTLAMEWSMNMLPASIEAESFRSVAIGNLRSHLLQGAPPDWAAMLSFPIFAGGASPGAPAAGQMLLVVPLEKPAFVESDRVASAAPSATASLGDPSGSSRAARQSDGPWSGEPHVETSVSGPPPVDRRRLLLPMPVTISVRLAQKRIELGQLMSIAPGALITFSKSCEDLLDLYVNNRRYCRGEAVKIGEKFGLKINEVGTEDVRETSVLF